MEQSLLELIPPLPSGPLDEYRQQASFCWKEMKVFYEGGNELFEFKYKVFKVLEKDPLFHRSPAAYQSISELRETAARQSNAIFEYNFYDDNEMMQNPRRIQKMSELLAQFDIAMNARIALSNQVFANAVLTLGTDRHQIYYEQAKSKELFGAFCLTELAHGSNTTGMGTTATYDNTTKEFVITTPRPEDMKCWVGNLGHAATHGLVYAQLVTPDGNKHGLHAFVVPLRDPLTLLPYPGVNVGDMGPKIGFNSIENGFVMFDRVRIPRENLLNRSADVTVEGKYVSAKSSSERHGLALGALSTGRIGIVVFGPAALSMAVTIALRYSAVRRQFALEEGGSEVAVIEYPLQRWRLFPYLAATYLLQHLAYSLFNNLVVFHAGILMGDKSELQNQIGRELHATSCAAKAISGFIMRDGLQECREACGGHGYLWAAQLGRLRADFDPVVTYEGDNNVILFQTANFLLAAWDEFRATGKVKSPLKSLDFLLAGDERHNISKAEDWLNPQRLLSVYRWIVTYRLRRAAEALAKLTSAGRPPGVARSELQPIHLRPLAISFSELLILSRFYDEVLSAESSTSAKLRPPLERLFLLFGLWRMQQHAVVLLESGYLSGSFSSILEAQALLCEQLKPDAIALVDAVAVPDFVLASPLGASDGQVYRRLIQTMLREPGAFDRPPYWKVLAPKTKKADLSSTPAKL